MCSSHQTDIYISTHSHPAQPVSVPMPPGETTSVVTNYALIDTLRSVPMISIRPSWPRFSAVNFTAGPQFSAVQITCHDLFIHGTGTHCSAGSHFSASIYRLARYRTAEGPRLYMKIQRNDNSRVIEAHENKEKKENTVPKTAPRWVPGTCRQNVRIL